MNTIKFSKNITDKQSEGINIKDAGVLLEKVNISNFELKQSGNQSWKVYGHKRHDTDQALIVLFQEGSGLSDDDFNEAVGVFKDSKLRILAKEKLIINLQASYRDLMMITLGLGSESAGDKKIREAKEKLTLNLEKRGLSPDDIQDVIRETFLI